MGMDPNQTDLVQGTGTSTAQARVCVLLVVVAALVGLGLMVDTLSRSSATFDEVLYLNVAAKWWRTGAQETITRAGSPLTFWKLQQTPMLWLLDRLGHGSWIDDPVSHEATLLWMARVSALLDLAGRSITDCLLEPSAVRAEGDGCGCLVVRAQPEPVGAWDLGDDGATDRGRDDRDDIPVLGLSTHGRPPGIFRECGVCRAGVVLQVHGGANSADLRDTLVVTCWRDGERGLVRIATRVAGGLVMFRRGHGDLRHRAHGRRDARSERATLDRIRASTADLDQWLRRVEASVRDPDPPRLRGVHSSSALPGFRDDKLFIRRKA